MEFERLSEQFPDIVALDIGRAESLRPPDENAMVDLILLARVRKRESERDRVLLRHVREVGLDELLDARRAKLEELPPVLLLLFLGESVFGLGDLELAVAEQGDEADPEVRAPQVERQIISFL